MKRIVNTAFVLLFLAVCSVAQAENLTLLKIDKGEICTADEGDIPLTLSKEKAMEGKKFCVKATLTKGLMKPYLFIITNDSNLLKGKRGDWSNYDTLKIQYFSSNKAPVETEIQIGDEVAYTKWSAKKQCIRKVTILPGQNMLSMDIKKLERTAFKGEFMDMDKIRGFFFKSDSLVAEDWNLYIQDVYLEKK